MHTGLVSGKPDDPQDWDRADERENTYWPSRDATLDDLVDSAFADAHLSDDNDIPEEEWASTLGPIALRIDDLATRFSDATSGVVTLRPHTGSVARTVGDIADLSDRLRGVIDPADIAGAVSELRALHHAAWGEYELLLPISDRIDTKELRVLVQRAIDVHIASQQCIRALGADLYPE